MPKRETLLSPSGIWLFGRVVEDLEIKNIDHNPFIGSREGCNNFLDEQLKCNARDGKKNARFARIYGFSYEGTYYDLPWPALFLVHGPGEDAPKADAGGDQIAGNPSRTGIGSQDFEFAADLKVWSYDRADLSMRLDPDSGTFEQILLEVFLGGDGGGPGVSGARVSGARVAGARVAGARVAGARVAGARARGGGSGD